MSRGGSELLVAFAHPLDIHSYDRLDPESACSHRANVLRTRTEPLGLS